MSNHSAHEALQTAFEGWFKLYAMAELYCWTGKTLGTRQGGLPPCEARYMDLPVVRR